MASALTVIREFGEYRPGDTIVEAEKITEVLSSQNAANVVATGTPEPPPQEEKTE